MGITRRFRIERQVLAVLSAVLMLAVVAGWYASYWRSARVARVTNRYPGDDLVVRTWQVVSVRGELICDWRVEEHLGTMKYLQEKDRLRSEALPVWRWSLMRPRFGRDWRLTRESPLTCVGFGYVSRDEMKAKTWDLDAMYRRATRLGGGPSMHWATRTKSRTLVLPYWMFAVLFAVMPVMWVYPRLVTRATRYRGFECLPPAPVISRAG